MKWNKSDQEVWSCAAGPFAVKVSPKGDGRWNWQIVSGEARNPLATGVATSLGAAKTATEQFIKRSGLV